MGDFTTGLQKSSDSYIHHVAPDASRLSCPGSHCCGAGDDYSESQCGFQKEREGRFSLSRRLGGCPCPRSDECCLSLISAITGQALRDGPPPPTDELRIGKRLNNRELHTTIPALHLIVRGPWKPDRGRNGPVVPMTLIATRPDARPSLKTFSESEEFSRGGGYRRAMTEGVRA